MVLGHDHSNDDDDCVFVRLCVSLFVCLFVWLCVCLCVCLFVCLCVCLFLRLFVCLSVSLFVCLFVCLLVCVFVVCLFVCLCVWLSVCLFVCLFVCVFRALRGERARRGAPGVRTRAHARMHARTCAAEYSRRDSNPQSRPFEGGALSIRPREHLKNVSRNINLQ